MKQRKEAFKIADYTGWFFPASLIIAIVVYPVKGHTARI